MISLCLLRRVALKRSSQVPMYKHAYIIKAKSYPNLVGYMQHSTLSYYACYVPVPGTAVMCSSTKNVLRVGSLPTFFCS